MRPATTVPAVPFAKSRYARARTFASNGPGGIPDPVVPFKPPCLTLLKLTPGPAVAQDYNFSVHYLSNAAPAVLEGVPSRLRTRPQVPTQPVPPRRPAQCIAAQSEKQGH